MKHKHIFIIGRLDCRENETAFFQNMTIERAVKKFKEMLYQDHRDRGVTRNYVDDNSYIEFTLTSDSEIKLYADE